MASHNRSRRSSLTSLSDETSGIYKNYPRQHADSSLNHSLDSSQNEPAADLRQSAYRFTPRLVSGSETPQSVSSFDFTVHDDQNQVTNSSLQVLLDSGDVSNQNFVSLASLADSTRSLDPLVMKIARASNPDDSLASYKNYDEKLNDNDWAEKGAAVSSKLTGSGTTVIRRTVKDFEFGKDLGEGSYSTVVLAKDKVTNKNYAVKILDKRHIIKEKKVKYVNIEKHALNRLSGTQGIISLFFTFQDRESLYFVLDYAANGELLGLIKKYGTLNEDCTRYLGAQILDAIHHMHLNGVIHRDIKPENILLDDKCRIRITDFGTAKLLERKKNGDTGDEEDYPLDVRAKSFVGTAEYVSPELLENKYCGKPGDLWAFGCILYQMIAGKPPFKATNEYLTFQKITKLQYAFSAGFPLILRDLIKKILVLQPSKRAKIDQIQEHHFFQLCDFSDPDLIWNKEMPELSPYKMNAQSMMKMPATQTPKKNVVKKTIRKTLAQNDAEKRDESNTEKKFSAATVAAHVMNKKADTSADKMKTPKTSNKSKQSETAGDSTPDYIPGTNILRPQINKMSSFLIASTGSSKSNKGLMKRNSSRVMEITPATAVEAAWQQYLSSSERVINVGQATVRKMSTEVFEKKNKGYIHDAPLGYNNKLQQISQRANSRSMLSNAVHGNRLRENLESSHTSGSYSEDDAITFHYDESTDEPEIPKEEDDENKLPSAVSNPSRLGRSLLKKFLPNTDKKQDNSSTVSVSATPDSVERRSIDPMEKVKSYTIVVTTFGRLLLFKRDDQKADYKLVCEIGLNFPFIQFKEVVSNSSGKFGKMIPTTGIFAVVALKTTFVFETEKYEVNQWVDALARSKFNQHEREREAEQKAAAKENQVSSPRLLDSPAFSSPTQNHQRRQVSTSGSREAHVQERLDPSPGYESKEIHMSKKDFKGDQKNKVVRKAPPPLPTSPTFGTGGFKRGLDSETIHAAQLAVLNSPIRTSSDYRRSSFTRDKNGINTGYFSPLSAHGGTKVTPMNSKFLARTRGNK